jgi:hypothetical protein
MKYRSGLMGSTAKAHHGCLTPTRAKSQPPKGPWLNGKTFVIDMQDLGYGEQRELFLSISGEKLNFRYTNTDTPDRGVSVDGEQGH